MKKTTPLRKAAEYLKSIGKIKTDKDLSKDLRYSTGQVSSLLSGYTKPSEEFVNQFENFYKISIADFEGEAGDPIIKPNNGEHYKDKLIEALESQIRLLEERNKELTERVFQRMDELNANLDKISKGQLVLGGVIHATLQHLESVRSHQQKLKSAEVEKISDKLIADYTIQGAKMGK